MQSCSIRGCQSYKTIQTKPVAYFKWVLFINSYAWNRKKDPKKFLISRLCSFLNSHEKGGNSVEIFCEIFISSLQGTFYTKTFIKCFLWSKVYSVVFYLWGYVLDWQFGFEFFVEYWIKMIKIEVELNLKLYEWKNFTFLMLSKIESMLSLTIKHLEHFTFFNGVAKLTWSVIIELYIRELKFTRKQTREWFFCFAQFLN